MGKGKPVVPDELAEPQTARLSAEKPLLASPAPAVKKAVCVLCSEPTDELICGACTDKVRAEAVEHKRWEEKVSTEPDRRCCVPDAGSRDDGFQFILGRGDWRKPKR
jgi:hypothetical protein